MEKIKNGIRRIPQSIILYVIFTCLMIGVISSKMNYYIDEIYSYGLANSTGEGIDMVIEFDKTYTPADSAYADYMMVQEGERFSYSNVWKNQTNDVHPPLYYALLHTICSFFPGTYSVWYAGAINIIFALLILFVMRKLILELTGNRYIMEILSVVFVFLSGILHAVSYMRMYIMAMFWIILLTYLFVRQIGNNRQTPDIKFLGCIYLTTVAGALTHYYVIVFAVCISTVYGIYLLCGRRGKELIAFVISMVLAGGTAVAVFPAMIQHIFFGYRGEEAISNLSQNTVYATNTREFFELINDQVFGGLLKTIAAILALVVMIRYAKNHMGILNELQMKEISFGFKRETIIRYCLVLYRFFAISLLFPKAHSLRQTDIYFQSMP